MKKRKKWILVKPYKAYIAIGLLITALISYCVSLTPIYESNGIIHIIIGLIVKNIVRLVIIAILLLAVLFVENQQAKKICGDEEGSDEP